jgi:hypothetical protein
MNKWTLGLAALGVVSLASAVNAEEKMNVVQTTLSATTINGYVNASAWWNPNTAAKSGGTPIYPAIPLSNGKQDGFNLDCVKIGLEKPLDATQNWGSGYKVDLLYGDDAGIYNGYTEDYAIQNAFLALRAPVGNGLDFKFGVFDALLGYETFAAGNNPNYTHSYGWGLEPVSMTGALMSYKFTDWLSAAGGIANTYGPTINQKAHQPNGYGTAYGTKAESYKTYTGQVALTATEDMGFLAGSAVYFGIINGFNSDVVGDSNAPGYPTSGGNQMNLYVGGTFNTPIKAVKVGASYDYAGTSTGGLWANAAAGYVSWQAMEKLTLFGRGEYTWRNDGYTMPGLPSKVVAGTVTLQYDLWENVLSRLELRWDRDATGGNSYSSANNGMMSNAFMVALNMIYKF